MKAVIKLDDVPEFQIGQMARVWFPDSAAMYGKCEPWKEQEAVRVTTRRIPANGGSIVWTCGECGADLAPNNAKAKYCSACGRKVKWE